jgi:transcription antitermination factor NusB
LYELDLSVAAADADPAAVLAKLATVDGLGPFQGERVRALVTGAWNARKAADVIFQQLAPEWPTHRLAAIDRAILRLGHFEASSKLTPARIVIHECIELARAFGTDKSPAFVNALLDKALQAELAGQDGGGRGLRTDDEMMR